MRRPRVVKLGDRSGVVNNLVASGDVVVWADPLATTTCVAASNWEVLWKVPSNRFAIGGPIGSSFLTVASHNEVGVRATDDGRMLWSTQALRCKPHELNVEVVQRAAIQTRAAMTGEVLSDVATEVPFPNAPWDGGSIWVAKQAEQAMGVSRDGRMLWRGMLGSLTISAGSSGPAAKLFINAGGKDIIAYSTEQGTELWRMPIHVSYGWPTVADGRVSILQGDRFVVLDEHSGAIVVDRRLPELNAASQCRQPLLVRGRLIFPHESGTLAVIAADTGELLHLYESKTPLWRAVEVDGLVAVGTATGSLLVFDEMIWG